MRIGPIVWYLCWAIHGRYLYYYLNNYIYIIYKCILLLLLLLYYCYCYCKYVYHYYSMAVSFNGCYYLALPYRVDYSWCLLICSLIHLLYSLLLNINLARCGCVLATCYLMYFMNRHALLSMAPSLILCYTCYMADSTT